MITRLLTAAGVRHRQGRFLKPPEGTYAVFFDDLEVDAADRVMGVRAPRIYHHDVLVELYEPKPDPEAEAAIEAALDAEGLAWTKEDREWLQDVQRYQVLYEFSYTSKQP